MNLPVVNINRSETSYWTPRLRFLAGQSAGRPSGRLPASHVDDLVQLRKAIMLCRDCVGKFLAEKAGYVAKKNLPFARGRCDHCQHYVERARMFVPRAVAMTA